jgi:hypothetical protein
MHGIDVGFEWALAHANMSCRDNAQSRCVSSRAAHCGNYTSLGVVDIAWEMFQKQALP